jgi:superfamily II DNA/RNA helicase
MDEADRMIDMGFEEDVRTIFSFFKVGNLLCPTSHRNTMIHVPDSVKQRRYFILITSAT